MDVYEKILQIFDIGVSYVILFVELIGILVLVYTVLKALVALLQKHERVRLDLAEGIALSLEFKLGGELLRTVVVREWEELLILGAVVLLRAAMTFLIQWEIRIEKKHAEERRLKQQVQNEKE
ncbi:MAG: DUF1622 domain-containing protein [Clostridia bacterium]|nr:DUF1622 domain-containing protein [Clostridia bacterium]